MIHQAYFLQKLTVKKKIKMLFAAILFGFLQVKCVMAACWDY